jgi:serine/threonine protein kinase
MKSENVFVTLDSQDNIQTLKIGDFDTSKIFTAAKRSFTRNQGTEGFMAPEMVAKSHEEGYTYKVDSA